MSLQESDFSFQPTLDEVGHPLSQTTFVVVDLETTGGSPLDSKITEFGAVKVRGGVVLGEFKTFVNPEMAIPAYITVLTGITDVSTEATNQAQWAYQWDFVQPLLTFPTGTGTFSNSLQSAFGGGTL